MKTLRIFPTVVVLFLFICSSIEAQTNYTVRDIHLPGGTNSHADGIDDLGRVVGGSETMTNNGDRKCGDYIGPDGLARVQEHAFLWINPTAMLDLGTLPRGTSSGADAVNLAGTVVGRSTTASTAVASSAVHGFRMELGGQMRDLGTLGGKNSNANDINNDGVIVGSSQTTADDLPVVSYRLKNGQTTQISLGGVYSEATAIDSAGRVVGGSLYPDNTTFHAFRWRPGSSAQDIEVAGNPFSMAFGMNDLEQIVGEAGNVLPCDLAAGAHPHAVLWSNGIETPLGAPENGCSHASAININGRVVGWATLQDGTERAFVWDAQSGMVDLNTRVPQALNWQLHRANAINSSGQIAGCGIHEGHMRAFLLTPVQ